jgi:hypothetical protein
MMQKSMRRRWTSCVALVGASAALGGCGYTDLEMAAKQRQIDALVTQVNTLKAGASATCPIDGRPSTRATSMPVLSSR